jgi:ribonuclease HI
MWAAAIEFFLLPILAGLLNDGNFKLKFDGCSKSNPGISGAGAVIYKDDEELWGDNFFVGLSATNNHAEYAGLILGLEKAIQINIKRLIVEGDSLLVINNDR